MSKTEHECECAHHNDFTLIGEKTKIENPDEMERFANWRYKQTGKCNRCDKETVLYVR